MGLIYSIFLPCDGLKYKDNTPNNPGIWIMRLGAIYLDPEHISWVGKVYLGLGRKRGGEMLLIFMMLFTLNKPPLLRVTPETGFSPLKTKVFTVRYPRPVDREWEIVLIDEGFVLRRYTVDLEGENGDRATTLEWTLPAGNFIIASCVYPNELCTTKHIEVK